MRLLGGILLLLVVTACGSSTAVSKITSPAPASLSPSPFASPSPSPVASPSPSPVAISSDIPNASPVATPDSLCWLPVVKDTMQGEFVSYPSGTVAVDPAGPFTQDPVTNAWRSNAQPNLRGSDQNRELSFDRATKRWLPAPKAAVRSDGLAYAYVIANSSFQNEVHVVDVPSGHERVFVIAHRAGFSAVKDYSPDGIYVDGSTENSEASLWLVDPNSGSERYIGSTSGAYDLVLGSGNAWLAYNLDPNRTNVGWDTIDIMDLATGKRSLWFHQDGGYDIEVGFRADGTPVIYSSQSFSGGPSVVWITTTPQNKQQIYSGPEKFTSVAGDSHGLWLFSLSGVYLYTPQQGLQKVSAAVGRTAGSCV